MYTKSVKEWNDPHVGLPLNMQIINGFLPEAGPKSILYLGLSLPLSVALSFLPPLYLSPKQYF